MFSDIEGRAARWDGDHDAMGSALARHDAMVHAAIGALRAFELTAEGGAWSGTSCHGIAGGGWTDTWVRRNGRWQIVAAEGISVPLHR